MTSAALIVVNYGSSALLERNLVPLAESAPWLRVYVVDCFRDPVEQASVGALAEQHGWRALLLERNLGFGGGVNRGADAAIADGAEVIVVLNPDATLPEASARALVDAAAADPAALFSPVVLRPDGTIWSGGMDLHLDDGSLSGIRFRERNGDRPRRMWVSGACFAISSALWRRVGGFDEDFFLYWEDVDLSHRILDAGGRLVIDDTITAVHDEGGTQQSVDPGRARSELFYYYNIRNRLLYAARHLDAETYRQWRRSTLRVSYGTLLGGGRRQLVRSIAPWRALARGMRDGLRGKVGP
ncbi:glycosyltransferase family 2 protein [Microbacterium sp.]|uniref:glycosyltransferase family 2 protein n=1 Tax=Microbacterium sp. TaxID=51671 RepID=UPI0039E2BE6C